jgi:hypothetical protein
MIAHPPPSRRPARVSRTVSHVTPDRPLALGVGEIGGSVLRMMVYFIFLRFEQVSIKVANSRDSGWSTECWEVCALAFKGKKKKITAPNTTAYEYNDERGEEKKEKKTYIPSQRRHSQFRSRN